MENTKIAKDKPIPVKPATKKSAKGAVGNKLVKKTPEKKGMKTNEKVKPKVKVVRDSFTMPQSDYSKLGELKLTCLKAGIQVKKSELLRAGLNLLTALNTARLKKVIAQVEQIKTGRPKNS